MRLRAYFMAMARVLLGVLALLLAAVAMPALAQPGTVNDDYSIMAPEPGTAAPKQAPEPGVAPKQPAPQPRKHPRGSSTLVTPTPLPPPLHYNPPPISTVTPAPHPVPPSMAVPQTGQVLPNLNAGQNETSQDRAIRCTHQAGVYGPNMTGDRNTYIGGCINQ